MRCGELLALTWGDVDLENGFVDIGKVEAWLEIVRKMDRNT